MTRPCCFAPISNSVFAVLILLLLLAVSFESAQAQTTTYYLHKENSSTSGQQQLKTALPEAAATTYSSAELRNQPDGDYLIKAFDTQAGVPNSPGVIPSGSAIKFKLWMRKTDNFGTMYARVKVNLNNATGAAIADCVEPFGTQGGPDTVLTTGFAARSFTCFTTADVNLTATDRFYLWVGVKVLAVGNNRVKAELRIEQGSDSNVVIPAPAPRPTISTLSPSSGPVDTPVVVNGSNFGATQGASFITFNGVMATPTTWSNTRIDARVPPGATSGPVIVTLKVASGYQVKSVVGNSVNYSVTAGTILGNITAVTSGAGIPAALVEALESGVFIAGARTNSSGAYSFSGLKAGTYDVRVSADSYKTETTSGVVVSVGADTTFNASLYKPGTISGRVTKSDGVTPIAGATLKVYQNGAVVSGAVTNGNGDYTVANLKPMTSNVQAFAAGYQRQTQSNITISEQGTSPVNFNLSATSHTASIKYAYDDLGRLRTVEDKVGEAAKYNYDAVGNLSGISRHLPSQVAILLFSPHKGIGGTQVTISGTGFSANAAENTVNFNGLATTVISATPSELVVNAPSGVTTGPITVTSPAGNATSSEPFTLNALAPTIAGFSPSISDPGAPITINGSNFEPVIFNNGATVGMSRAAPTSGTTTDLTVTVPTRGGSGKVSVSTPNGKAVSTDDFFYPPRTSYSGCCTAAQIEYAQRIAIGEAKTMTISTPDKVGILIFDAQAGQRIGIQVNNQLATTPRSLSFSVFNPDGSFLVDNRSINGPGFFFEDTSRTVNLGGGGYITTLSLSGTYTILIDPSNSATGNVTVDLRIVPPDLMYTITPGGPSKTVTISSSGQNALLTFFGIAGQRISLRQWNSTMDFGTIVIYQPNGDHFASTSLETDNNNPSTRFIDTKTLPETGTYSILVNPSLSWTGSVNLTLYDVPPDITGTITPGGPAVTVATTVPGQDAKLTFNGTAGQRVTVLTRNISAWDMYATLLGPTNTSLFSDGPAGQGKYQFLDVVSLPTTGTHTVYLDADTIAGSMSATVYNVPPDITGNITINGTPFNVTLNTAPGQNGWLFFNGTAGQLATLRITGNSFSNLQITVYRPDNTILVQANSGSASFNLPQRTLNLTGTYKISVNPLDPWSAVTTFTPVFGSANVAVTSP